MKINFNNIKTKWDLDNYYSSFDDKNINKDFDKILILIDKFISKYKGKIKDLNSKNFIEFFNDKNEFERIIEKIALFYFYKSSLDTQNQNIIKKQSEFDFKMLDISNKLLFLSQEFKELGYDKLIELSNDESLYKYKNYFYQKANSIKYILSEKEEFALNLKSNSGSEALNNLYEELTNSFMFDIKIDGKIKSVTDSEIRTLRMSTNPEIRKKATESIRKVYNDKKVQITLGNIYSSIIKDWTSEIELRGFNKNVLEQRNISEELDNDVVDILIEEVKNAYPIYQKYLKIKSKLLNVDRINSYDLLAPISNVEKEFKFENGLKLFLETIKEFDEEFYNYSINMFEKGRVDVFPKEGKRGGAFAQYVQGFESYVLLNYTNKLRDVSTLAHELGHAMHGHLSQIQEPEVFSSALSLAETASIFNEMLLSDKILNSLNNEDKLDFIEKRLEDVFATIFRQIQYVSFEKRAHKSILNKKELTYTDFNKMWREEQVKMTGDIVVWDVEDEFESSWSSIPHIFRTPFYCYSYAFGNILTFALFDDYKKDKVNFIEKYKNILKSGGSKTPYKLLIENGFDIKSRDYYKSGLNVIKNMVDEFEILAEKSMKK